VALWSEAVRLLSTIPGAEMRDIVRGAVESMGGRGLARGQFLDLNASGKPETIAEVENGTT